jgi:hypothetical protein
MNMVNVAVVTPSEIASDLRYRFARLAGEIDSQPQSMRIVLGRSLDLLLDAHRSSDGTIRDEARILIQILQGDSTSERLSEQFGRLQRAVDTAGPGTSAPVAKTLASFDVPSTQPLDSEVRRSAATGDGEQALRWSSLFRTILVPLLGSGSVISLLIKLIYFPERPPQLPAQSVPLGVQETAELLEAMTVRNLGAEQTIHWIQALLLGVATAVLCSAYAKPPPSVHGQAAKALAQFKRGIFTAYFTWTAIYAMLATCAALADFDIVQLSDEPIAWAVADVLNAAVSGALLYAFCALDKARILDRDDEQRERAFRRSVMSWWICLGLVGAVSAVSRFGLLGRAEPGTFINSLLAGCAIAYLVGRFDSHWMDLPRPVLLPLYILAMLQVAYGVLSGLSSGPRIILLVASLGLQLWFIAVITHSVREGHVSEFLERSFDWQRLRLGSER